MIYPILNSKFKKVHHQKVIKAKYKGEPERFKIIDFIATDGKEIYLFEQKKNPDNASIQQINEYEFLVNYLSPNWKVNKYFIFETIGEEIPIFEGIKSLTINQLSNEFCR